MHIKLDKLLNRRGNGRVPGMQKTLNPVVSVLLYSEQPTEYVHTTVVGQPGCTLHVPGTMLSTYYAPSHFTFTVTLGHKYD